MYNEKFFENLYKSDFNDFVIKSQDEAFMEDLYDSKTSLDEEEICKKENVYIRLFYTLSHCNLMKASYALFKGRSREGINTVGQMYDSIVSNLKEVFEEFIRWSNEDGEEYRFIDVAGYLRGQYHVFKEDDNQISVVNDIFFYVECGTNEY